MITLYQKAIDFELVDKLLQLHLSTDIDNLSPWQELLLFDFNIYLPDDHTDELFACFDMLIRVCYGVNLKMEDVVYDNFNYHGPIFFGQGTGNCKIAYHDGSTYVGDIINGKCNGRGIYICNGKYAHKYKGEFLNNKYHGKGIKIWKDNDRYEGDFVNGLYHGKGIEIWHGSGRYKGDFVKGERW